MNRDAEGIGRRLCIVYTGRAHLLPRGYLWLSSHTGVCGVEFLMNINVRTGVALGWLWVSVGAVAAGDAVAAPDAVGLGDVVVTATRIPEPVNQVLESVVVIDRAALQNSLAVDVADVLRFHAGLDIGRSGGPGQPVSLFIRGANSNQTIVMIDGVRINSGTQSLAPLMNISPELFERIEVVKGPRSAIYGTDAIGGVVNLITRAGGPSGADLMLSYGRYGTGEFAADGNYSSGATNLQAVISGQKSRGFPAITGDTLDRGYKNFGGTAAVTTRVDGVELGARYWRAAGTTDYTDQVYSNETFAFLGYAPVDESFTNSLFTAHASGDITDIWHARLNLSRFTDDLRQHQFDSGIVPPTLPAKDYDTSVRDAVDFQNDVKLVRDEFTQLLTFGATVAKEKTKTLSFGAGYSVDTGTQNYYLQDQVAEGADRLLLSVGGFHHPAFGSHTTWNAEYGRSISSDTLLTVSLGTAFRAPTATDRFGFAGTPSLKPESSRSIELGFKSRIGGGKEITLAAYQNTINDLIVFLNDFNNFTTFGNIANVSRARIRGVEASWEIKTDQGSLRAEANLQDPRNLSYQNLNLFDNSSQLLRRSKHSFTFSGTRVIGHGELGIDLLLDGPRVDVGGTQDGGYVLAALYGKVNMSPEWSVSARLDNALNRHYELANGYNTAARSVLISTRFSFR